MHRHRRRVSVLRSRAFKLSLLVALLVLALFLKGEKVTLGALLARLLDLFTEIGAEGAVRKD